HNAVRGGAKTVVLATHSWHTHASVEKGALSGPAIKQNLANLEAVLSAIQGMAGADFVMAREAARKV
ncbi:MAG: hypothetical protein Q8P02_04075, partial [Candidatus Micrarchaeota archaeon]|nr:hypothetical protein [Candidatus Micrarchaeota archaeon]